MCGVNGSVSAPLQRIAVVGVSGSGKTYVAQALSARLSIPYVCNDALIWQAEWCPVPPAQEYRNFDVATAGRTWVIDGNLNPRSPADQLVLGRIDTLVWLDLPRREVWPQLLRRSFRRAWTKEELWHGNRESWLKLLSRDSILWWSVKTHQKVRRRYEPWMTDAEHASLARIWLRSRREVERWLQGLTPRGKEKDRVRLGASRS